MAFAEWLRKLKAPPKEQRTNAAAARVIDLWHARQARSAEPLLVPTIASTARAGRPWLLLSVPSLHHDRGRTCAASAGTRITDPKPYPGPVLPALSRRS